MVLGFIQERIDDLELRGNSACPAQEQASDQIQLIVEMIASGEKIKTYSCKTHKVF